MDQKMIEERKTAFKVIAKNEGFLTFYIDKCEGLAKGQNFVAEVNQATIVGTKPDKTFVRINVFIKYSPTDLKVRKRISITKAFDNESHAYCKLLPALYQLQNKYGIDINESFKAPRCLGTSLETYKEFVAMEDVNTKGFEKFNYLKPLDYDHLRLMIKKTANFHGTVFALKELDRDLYDEMANHLSGDIFYTKGANDNVPTFLLKTIMYEKSRLTNQDQVRALEELLHDLLPLVDYLTSKKAAEPYDVICHGDLWTSNFLFKYNKDKIPSDICFLDWQFTRCGSLFTDLIYMIFMCTDGDIRQKYHSNMFSWYYSDLGDTLSKFNINVNNVYPRDKFNSDAIKFAPYGTAIALAYSLLSAADPTNIPDVGELLTRDEERMQKQLDKLSPQAISRIGEIVRDYTAFGYNTMISQSLLEFNKINQ